MKQTVVSKLPFSQNRDFTKSFTQMMNNRMNIFHTGCHFA